MLHVILSVSESRNKQLQEQEEALVGQLDALKQQLLQSSGRIRDFEVQSQLDAEAVSRLSVENKRLQLSLEQHQQDVSLLRDKGASLADQVSQLQLELSQVDALKRTLQEQEAKLRESESAVCLSEIHLSKLLFDSLR